MPMRQPSPITAPWTMAPWPTMQPRPMTTGDPGSVWITTPSWMLVSAATEIRSMSPRSTAPGHTVTPSSSTTSPMIVASGCTKTPGPNWGTLSPNALMDMRASIPERAGGGPHEVRTRRDQDQGPRGSDQVLRAARPARSRAAGAHQGQGDAGVHGAGGRQLRHRARLQLGQGRRLPRRRALRPLRLRDRGHRRRAAGASSCSAGGSRASRTCSRATARGWRSSRTRTATRSS